MPNISAVFLDRDGVINEKLEGDYVKRWDEFKFLPDAIEAIRLLNEKKIPVYIISNQSGIGRGLMSIHDLNIVHQNMIEDLIKHNAHVDDIFVCPHAPKDNCDCRKPKAGLLLQAKAKYSAIDFMNSWFIGDSETDILAAKAVNCNSYLVKKGESLKKVIMDIVNGK